MAQMTKGQKDKEKMSDELRKSCLQKDRPCLSYSRSLGRCKRGYVNPATIRDGVSAAKSGLLKPCPYTVKGRKVLDKLKQG